MEHKVLIAGFGGQGVIVTGTLLAHAAMYAGKNTTFYPAYGIAMRGGMANCTVVVSDEEIGSPVVAHPTVLIVMNTESLDYFLPRVEEGTIVVVNASLVNKEADRNDVRPVYVRANDIANEYGDSRMANMAMLGGMIKATGMLPLESVHETMKKILTGKLAHMLKPNQEVLRKGFDSVK
ncbi:MAG: 2-oxoacid:ferredoxin oxidoreductase subunit gamma [Candidatus Raymondbacteria bacterium RifOxyA12_full_50_37]|uniref:2-oxoacid:ferredoxin oxidoreductase subunit gamma n=1 Tax=Candidatus Raymondbacteria bacterium RIFOXYD12_FULL_49_13 TaxID=1817890 RepID=A0A1F7FK71_UNCRA|nr:MAG: 2-oxoacid:ferredoxin oxidoreductase subunit gamma [Candidatus Raymondbacteria bacterium RifOxyA12_full_50_37]OGJ90173.1 MAG: 2-oxoacid:ferredoxin oxidoreductase subunit gamma [Candidatus Raymondbacteria bacterium RIFOXYA2_FULL_49_16]OGJ97245.1 MAG: 2-oxoacid:ferredoxin oxidoreductase subunit gamma [Candidatus Raymondbacteria bacterium RIFOXYC2_FULL_50_21]OGJ98837.1 MAG: 2-oxoacid:ferredoxin oxidoreductase subunit gamma [Candidatus Raymondbacteria bacterium RifOxyB12_full_50_8]OGK07124.1